MSKRNYELLPGHKWDNIKIEKMIYFLGNYENQYGTQKMGGYISLFVYHPIFNIGGCYDLLLCGYNTWGKQTTMLVRLNKIRSLYPT